MTQVVLVALVAASWVWWVVACLVTREFFRSAQRRTPPDTPYEPPLSILKPVKGLDYGAYENFASFCEQGYELYEILFGVADAADPCVAVVKQLQHDFAHLDIRLIIAPAFGPNRKASLLHHLSSAAQYDLLVISDSDMRVTRDYLSRVVAPLAREDVGLVTCPYRGEDCRNLPSRLEALHMGATFLPSVLVARRVVKGFALGATVALHKADLAQIGGFADIAEYLADDYELGARVAEAGKRVEISDYVVASVLGTQRFRSQWHREVRWARCIRVCRPCQFPGILLSFSTPLAALLLLASDFGSLGWAFLAVSLALRWAVAWLVSGYSGDGETRQAIAWLPLRDVLSSIVWFVGLFGRHIHWRGEEYILLGDGRMVARTTSGEGLARPIGVGWGNVLKRWRKRYQGRRDQCSCRRRTNAR